MWWQASKGDTPSAQQVPDTAPSKSLIPEKIPNSAAAAEVVQHTTRAAPSPAECENSKTNFALASQAHKDEDYLAAHEHYSQALSTARTVELKSAILVSRSACLCAMNRWHEALADSEEAIRIRKSWSRSYSSQAAALHGLGRSEEADRSRRLSEALANLKNDPKNEVQSFIVIVVFIFL